MIPHDVALYHLGDLLLDVREFLDKHRDTPHWTLAHAMLFDTVARIETYNRAALDGQTIPCTSQQIEHIELLIATTKTDPQALFTAYKIPDLAHLTYDQAELIIARQRKLRLKQRLQENPIHA